jgi:hypothetical protein
VIRGPHGIRAALRGVGRFQAIVLSDRLVKRKNVGPGENHAKDWDVCATLEYSSKNAGFSANVAQVKIDMF